ncbi:Uncharacterised protein [Vibrio cholerae]|nr:Uncharacterised protein [Vibrio cholerae]
MTASQRNFIHKQTLPINKGVTVFTFTRQTV